MAATTEAQVFAILHHMPVEGSDWEQWKARIWNQIADGLHGYPGLAPLEQWMWRSQKERRCIDCGSPGEVEQVGGGLIASVRSYWMCQPCHDWHERKGA